MALSAPHEGDEEIVFPQTLRPAYMSESCGVVCDVVCGGVVWWYKVWWCDVVWCDGMGWDGMWWERIKCGVVVLCHLMLCIVFDLTSCFLIHPIVFIWNIVWTEVHSLVLCWSTLFCSRIFYLLPFFFSFFRSSIWAGIPSEFIKWKITWKNELEISSSWWWKYQFCRRYLRLIIPIYFNVFNSILFHFISFEFISLS